MTPEELLTEISPERRDLLAAQGFDAEEFVRLRARYLCGEMGRDANKVNGSVAPPRPEDVLAFPDRESAEGRRLIARGRAALQAGEVGALVLNGGMATRFGGVVKGCVNVFDELSFLGVKILDARRWGADLLLMNSFSTDQETRAYLEEIDHLGHDPERVRCFNQHVSIRLTPRGELYRDDSGDISLYAPGHGDLPSALNRGVLQDFLDGGGKYLLMSNVDNVLATLDPLVVGAHIDSGAQMTVECVKTRPGYKGGMVARVAGVPQVVEHFRIPDEFDQAQLDLLNTNTFCFDADALVGAFELNWYVVSKEVHGQQVIQFERLAGELSSFLKTRFIEVPNQGRESRFLPVKRPKDLEENREMLADVVAQRGLLGQGGE